MKTIEQLAREAGWTSYDSLDERLQRFHNLATAQYRESLLAGVGEPEGSAEVFTGMNEHGLPEYAHVDAYTADNLAAAVLRERERCLSHAQSIVDFYGDADTGMHPLQVRERECAAQIAAAIKEHLK